MTTPGDYWMTADRQPAKNHERDPRAGDKQVASLIRHSHPSSEVPPFGLAAMAIWGYS